MHTNMKVLTITLLACAVVTIQPAEAQLRFSVAFSEDGYAVQEGNSLTVRVDSNFDALPGIPQFINVAVHATVVVQEDANCQPGSDLRLPDGPNGVTATLMFNRSHPSDSFDIQVPCDGLVEGLNQRCTLMFGAVTIPDSVRNILAAIPGAPAVLNIRECDDDYIECKWNKELVEVTEGEDLQVMLLSSCSRRHLSTDININVLCIEYKALGVTAASQGSDWNVVGSTTLHFTGSTTFDPKTDMFADEPIVISIVNDESAEPIEALICSLQVGVVQSVRTVDPKQVTIVINDDDGSCSPWLKGSCSTLPCGGVGVRTDVRLCTSPTASDGRVNCRGEQWRNTTCFACPCGGGWSSWSEGVCSENRQGQRVREDSRICTTPDHPECCFGSRTRTSPCPENAVHGGWSAWNVGYCSKTCGGSGVRTDWRACNSPPPLLGGNHCHGPASRTMPCYTCPCGGGWSNWVEGTCSKTCGLGTRLDRQSCTTPDHLECCPGCGLRQSNCSVAECPVHGGWSSWLEATSCSVSCGGGTKFLVRECNEPVPAHGGNDCDGLPYRVESCNTCPCNAGWSSWVPGACGAPCGQNGTAIATRKCRGPSECCPGEGKRTEVCTSPPCQGR